MTRGEIKRRIRLLGKHYFSSDLDLDPFGLDLLVQHVADEVARNTDCYVGRRYLDLVAGTSEYCASDLYRLKNIMALQPNGDYKRLLIVDWYDSKTNQYRDASDTNAIPSHVLIFGGNRMKFWPVPNTASTNAILIEGYAVPGDVWVYDVNGNPVTLDDTSECPLPEIAHDAIVYGVLHQKAIQNRDADMVGVYRDEYERRVGMVESFAATYARRAV